MKLFQVAIKYNTSTNGLRNLLEEQGFSNVEKHDEITPEMYACIQKEFGSQQYDKGVQEDIPDVELGDIDEEISIGDDFLKDDLFVDTSKENHVWEKEESLNQEKQVVLEKIDNQFIQEEEIKDDIPVSPSVEEEVVQQQEETKKEVESPPSLEQVDILSTDDNAIKVEDSDEKSKIKGTKIVGRIDIAKESQPLQIKRKLRKRKGKETDPEEGNVAQKNQNDNAKEVRPKKKGKLSTKKKKGSFVSLSIDEDEVKKQIKKTKKTLHDIGIQRGSGQRKKKQRIENKDITEIPNIVENHEYSDTPKEIEISELLTTSDLCHLLGVSINDVISKCLSLGIMLTINQRLEATTIELICEEFGYKPIFINSTEDILEELSDDNEVSNEEDMVVRPPIITVMGHVDHGKTSLLDYIRSARIVHKEHGGITQHIGAYLVRLSEGKTITFLDTPGHQAFTAMRARGTQITDIVVLVVAADDKIMPQTIESINHAKAAGVPIVVAINKIDKPNANSERIKQELASHNILVEEYNGTYQCAEISAKKGTGIDELLEKVLIEAELMELKANPNLRAVGTVLEARLDRRKGVIINLLIQSGTLKVGDPFIVGASYGRVRAMENSYRENLKEATPSVPVQLTGAKVVPSSGDKFIVTKNEQMARTIAYQRDRFKREQDIRKGRYISLKNLSDQMSEGEIDELKLIIKADVGGSLEAMANSLTQLGSEKMRINFIHESTGDITETDILLASASSAIIIGFQVQLSVGIRKLAEREGVEVNLFNVIYQAIESIEKAIKGQIKPIQKEYITGTLQVRNLFKVSKLGIIAGCIVSKGQIRIHDKVRLLRKDNVVYEGKVQSLKRFQDDVTEVKNGYECGVALDNFNNMELQDIIQVYELRDVEK